MKISEVLWKAANDVLDHRGGICDYTCHAVIRAQGLWDTWGAKSFCDTFASNPALSFLEELGCPIGSGYAFGDIPAGEISQGARYLWLDFARLVAEDEGL